MSKHANKVDAPVPELQQDEHKPNEPIASVKRCKESVKRYAVQLLTAQEPKLSYKQVIARVFEETGNRIDRSTLYRWAQAIEATGSPSVLGRPQAKSKRSGRGNSAEGTFRERLVPYLNANFRTRNELANHQQWTYWLAEEIQFCLVFGVLPPRIVNLGTQKLEAPDLPVEKSVTVWRKWCADQVSAHRRNLLSPEVQTLVDSMRADGHGVSKEPPGHGRGMRYNLRTIKDALRSAGFKTVPPTLYEGITRGKPSPHGVGGIWYRIDPGETESDES